MTVQRLTIHDWHPARLNELLSGHWAVRAKRKRQDREIIFAYARQQDIEQATSKRRVDLEITIKPRQRAGDPDAYWKSLLDALVHTRLLVNDSYLWVEMGSVTFLRAACKSTTIVLTDLADA